MFSAGNQDIMNAIGGVEAKGPDTTLSTGLASADMPAQSSGLPSMQMPQTPGTSTPNYLNTGQQFFGGQQQFNPLGQMYQPIVRHGIGKDNWTSNMGLDQQAILQNLGLGGQ